jgi:putative transposase
MDELYRNRFRIKSNRLPFYNYSSEGAYFITICTAKLLDEFGEILDGKMSLNRYGEIIKKEWYISQQIRKEISFGEFCIMPNHIHGIVYIGTPFSKFNTPEQFSLKFGPKNKFGKQTRNLSTFINQFKGSCTRKIIAADNKSFAWQPNYYDHIIRNQNELFAIEKYIRNNPSNWDTDKFFHA